MGDCHDVDAGIAGIRATREHQAQKIFVKNPDLLKESLLEIIECDSEEAVNFWVKDWLRIRELEAQIKAGRNCRQVGTRMIADQSMYRHDLRTQWMKAADVLEALPAPGQERGDG